MKTSIAILGAISLICLTDAYRKVPVKPAVSIICPCQYKFEPVCGSDHVTYMNKCVLDCTSLGYVQMGLPPIKVIEECECSGNCNCQKVDLPVCTLNGQTFPNECELACENIKRIANKKQILYLAYRTACLGVPGDCTDVTAPVCGTNDVLYRNKCVLNAVNTYNIEQCLPPITVKNPGICKDSYLCPITNQPVCGSDGIIYNNLCELEAENERRRCSEVSVFVSEADPSVCQKCYCPKINNPICATDGNTYRNPCLLDCEISKQNNPSLKALYKGECQVCQCQDKYLPVCGTDRKTYDNECLLECENIGRSEDLPPLKVFHIGECQHFLCDCEYCSDSYQPVCGSDMQTYWNLCWLQCNDRCCQKNGLSPVFLAKKGPCE